MMGFGGGMHPPERIRHLRKMPGVAARLSRLPTPKAWPGKSPFRITKKLKLVEFKNILTLKRRGIPVGDYVKNLNEAYYNKRGTDLYKDFDTYQNHAPLAHSVAQWMHRAQRKKEAAGAEKGLVHVLKVGIGDAGDVPLILQRMKELDEIHGTEIHKRIRFTLGDFSNRVLEGARENPELQKWKSQCKFIEMDATNIELEPDSVDFIHLNELWDDLSARSVIKKNGKVYEQYVTPRKGMGKMTFKAGSRVHSGFDVFRAVVKGDTKLLSSLDHDDFKKVSNIFDVREKRIGKAEMSAMKLDPAHLKEGVAVTWSPAILKTLDEFGKVLKPGGQGISIDYGFGPEGEWGKYHEQIDGSMSDETSFPKQIPSRQYGGQPTQPVNFDVAMGHLSGDHPLKALPLKSQGQFIHEEGQGYIVDFDTLEDRVGRIVDTFRESKRRDISDYIVTDEVSKLKQKMKAKNRPFWTRNDVVKSHVGEHELDILVSKIAKRTGADIRIYDHFDRLKAQLTKETKAEYAQENKRHAFFVMPWKKKEQ